MPRSLIVDKKYPCQIINIKHVWHYRGGPDDWISRILTLPEILCWAAWAIKLNHPLLTTYRETEKLLFVRGIISVKIHSTNTLIMLKQEEKKSFSVWTRWDYDFSFASYFQLSLVIKNMYRQFCVKSVQDIDAPTIYNFLDCAAVHSGSLSAIRGIKKGNGREARRVRGGGTVGGEEEVVEQNPPWCSPADWLTYTERAEGEGRSNEREK